MLLAPGVAGATKDRSTRTRPGVAGTPRSPLATARTGRRGLLRGQRLTRPAGLALRGVDQRGDVVHDVTAGLGVTDYPGQRVVRDRHRAAGVILRQLDQDAAHVVRGQLPQLDAADDGGDRLEDVTVERDGPGRPAAEALGQPVVYGALDRVGVLGLHAGVPFGLELLELLGHLGQGPT